MTVSLASLLVQQTKDQIYTFALGVATAVGLPVTSWQAGDPTRSLFAIESEMLATLESTVVGYIQSGFLDFATGQWLEILADQVYSVTVPPATAATTLVRMTNNGGGLYADIEAGDLTFKSTVNGKTYRNSTGGTLASGPGTFLDVTVIADEVGSASSAGVAEINYMVTALNGVACSNAAAAVGIDKQSEATTRQQCRDKLGSLSPNGPKEAYSYVARNPTLAGTNGVTRVRVYGNSTNGQVVVYLAGPAGAVSAADLALVAAAELKYATPLCITPVIQSAANVTVPVTYEIWVYKRENKTAAQVQAAVSMALTQMLAARPIGGDIIAPATTGKLYVTLVESTIKAAIPEAFRVNVTAPAVDVSLANGEVASLGLVTATVNIVSDP